MLKRINYKITVSFVLLSIITIGSIFYFTKDRGNSPAYRTVSSHGVIAGYSNLNDMEKNAHIIVVGYPTQDFLNREFVTTKYSDGEIQDYYTLTDINIEKVIKNNSSLDLEKDKSMRVIEPVVIIDDANGDKTKLTLNDYVEMQTNTSYLLFIQETLPGVFGIMNFENGRFITDKASANSKGVSGFSSDLHEQLKTEAFEKYGLNQ